MSEPTPAPTTRPTCPVQSYSKDGAMRIDKATDVEESLNERIEARCRAEADELDRKAEQQADPARHAGHGLEMWIGFKLFAEAFTPGELVRQAVAAERAGFDFVEISDHFHPWLDDHGHSGFAWSILAAIALRTERIELATGVTCPFIRYHPAVVAQAAATAALLSDGWFVLGLGAGERLNEHVVGQGWPAVEQRHKMLREAVEIIRLLWSGGYHSYRGRHLTLEDARVFDLPARPPLIAVAAGGPN